MVDEGWGGLRAVVGLGYQLCSIACRTDSADICLTIVVGRYCVRVVGVPRLDKASFEMLCISWRGMVVCRLKCLMLCCCI